MHPRYLGTWLFLGILRLCAVLPRRLSLAVGAAVGWIFLHSNAKRRHIASTNIALCFPELAESQRRQMVRQHFIAAGQISVDLGLIWWAPVRRLAALFTTSGIGPVTDAIASGRGVVLLAAHMLTADAGGIWISRSVPGMVMMKPMPNRLFDWFICKGRSRFGALVTLREQGLRPLVRTLRAGRMCYYVPDEDFGPERSVFAPFFGVPTATLPVLGSLVRLSDAVVFSCFAGLDRRSGRYHLTIGPPVDSFPADELASATLMNRLIEEGIRTAPEQYMWTLRLFRTRPDGGPSPYG